MNKKLVCPKDIILWVAALIFFISAISVLAYTPVVVVEYLKCDFATATYNTQRFTFEISKWGGSEIDWRTAAYPFVAELPSTAWTAAKTGDPVLPKLIAIKSNPLFLVSIICFFVAAFGIVGFTFLKPCKGRTWGFILFIVSGLAGAIFYIVACALLNDEIVSYLHMNFKVGDGENYTISNYWMHFHTQTINGTKYYSYMRVKGDAAYIRLQDADAATIGMWFPFIGFVVGIVGTSFRSPKVARGIVEEKPAEQPKEEKEETK